MLYIPMYSHKMQFPILAIAQQNQYPLFVMYMFWSILIVRCWSIWFSHDVSPMGRWQWYSGQCKAKDEGRIWIFPEAWGKRKKMYAHLQ